jgi:acyl phosphate:glycerol-3-phosphate acyltransferase
VNIFIAVIAVVAAYFIGTLPSAIIIARSKGVDITSFGSGNPGASNVARALGWKYGGLVFLFDAAKGAIPVAAMLSDRPVA